MLEVVLLASIVGTSPTVPATPPVIAPTPKPIYTPPPAPSGESWSDKMWRRYKEASR